MASKVQTKIKIPSQYSNRTATAIANDLIDLILARTEKGEGSNGKKFPKYSSAYKKSFEFQAAGKGNNVDLRLSGEMLNELSIVSVAAGEIVIGYNEDSSVAGRVEGNVLGSYGGDPDSKKARNFLELSEKEIQGVLNNYPLDVPQRRFEETNATELANILARQISRELAFNDESE
jgi:hypothetical protein